MRAAIAAIALLSLALCGCCALTDGPEAQRARCEASGGAWGAGATCSCPQGFALNKSQSYCMRCAQGERVQDLPNGFQECHKPSAREGLPCDSRGECPGAFCELVDGNASTGKGICRDYMYCCHVWIDERGGFSPDLVACVE
jgi:hypothetical protein